MRWIRFVFRWTYFASLLVVLFLNLRWYAASPLAANDGKLPPTLLAQLRANRQAIDSGSPAEMQKLFPEGFYFCHALHGLTWVEAALREPTLKGQAITEAKQAVAALESEAGRAPFPPELPPGYGMFYCAWKADLKAGIVLLSNDAVMLSELRNDCDALVDALQQSKSPFLASYAGSVWPCDTLPAIHALVVYDRVTGEERYSAFVQRWIANAKTKLDPQTGLIPHLAVLPNGEPGSVARATSQVMILRSLADIDPEFAQQQYLIFREKYMHDFAGIPAVREYPHGTNGRGDVDSGPLIGGRSLSATVLMIAVAQMYGDQAQAEAIAKTGEVIGLPWTSDGEKRYVGGVLPVGDIIVGYAYSARTWLGGTSHQVESPRPLSMFWRWQVHLMSMCLLIPTIIDWRIAKWRSRRAAGSNGRANELAEEIVAEQI